MPNRADVISLRDVSLRDDGVHILEHVSWQVASDQSWVVLGANGSGKTSLLRLAAMERGPSSGEVAVLGETYGRCDVRTLRRRIGFVSAATLDRFRPQLTARVVVMTGKHAALEPWWHTYDEADEQRAAALLEMVGCSALLDRPIGRCSEGERKRILVARALMADPELLLLDEPCAGLDLGAREALLEVVDRLIADPDAPTLVLTTHHLEEIPRAATHALVLREGAVLAAGDVETTVTSSAVSEAFGVDVVVTRDEGRFSVRTASGR